MKSTRCHFVLIFSFFFLLSGCASFLTRPTPLSFDQPEPCKEFLNRLDELVIEADVKDASSVSIPGFPYLRTNRFLAALKKDLKDDRQKEEWIRMMRELDFNSREKELHNLPDQAIASLDFKDGRKVDRERLYVQVNSCSSMLLNHDQSRLDFYVALSPRVLDEYSCLLRIMGLYPFVALPVALVTDSSREKMRKRFETDLKNLPIEGELKAFIPEKKIFLPEDAVREIIEASMKNPLAVPLPDGIQVEKLVWSFAPILIQDVVAPYDRLGEVIWKEGRVEVNPEKPTVYYYLSHAFLKGKPILQINYVIWYLERAGESPPWIEKGHLDGLTIRISLDDRGKIFMVDIQNNCGCYHFFAPQKERVEKALSRSLRFDPFVAQWLPVLSSGEKLGIRINSGWHQVQRLIPVDHFVDSIPYRLIPYDVLETLPHKEGQTESIFNSKGIVKGSERVERFILFPMGIPSIGSMRQRDHHATELIGKDHFDNPYLFDQNFLFR